MVFTEPIGLLDGTTAYKGGIAMATLGAADTGFPGGIVQLDPYTGWSWLLNNWFGLHFYIKDIVALPDGTLLFTNVSATIATTLKNGETAEGVWALPPAGPARMLIDDLYETPNSVALTPDAKTLYVTTWAPLAFSDTKEVARLTAGNKIYSFDLVMRNGGTFAGNRRLFAAIDIGFADGLKVDRYGSVWPCAGDGVQVFNAGRRLIGKTPLPLTYPNFLPLNRLSFAINHVVMLRHTRVTLLTTNTTFLESDSA